MALVGDYPGGGKRDDGGEDVGARSIEALIALRAEQGPLGRAARALRIVEAVVSGGPGPWVGFTASRTADLLHLWARLDPEANPAGRTDDPDVWGVSAARTQFARLVERLADSPQAILDTRSLQRAPVVVLAAETLEEIVATLERATVMRYATGAMMARDVGHPGPPSRLTALPRRPTPRATRRLPTDGRTAALPQAGSVEVE